MGLLMLGFQKYDHSTRSIWSTVFYCQIWHIIALSKKKTECVLKTHDRNETFVLQGNIVIIHQSLLNSIFTTKLYILMKEINYKQRQN
jgi:hypothetical protein